MENVFDLQLIKSGFETAKVALDSFKGLRDLVRSNPEAEGDIETRIEHAKQQFNIAEAQIAQGLGYKLCRAHFPPVPMLRDRVHPEYVEEIFKCPECGTEEPSPEYFSQKDRFTESISRHNERAAKEYNW